MIILRDYRPADIDAVIDVFLSAIRQTASADYTQAQVEAWAQVARQTWQKRRRSRPTWVAEMEGSVAGFTDLEADGHLDMMYVHPRCKGRGVATSLLNAAEQHAREAGLSKIYCEVSITARPFFEAQGYLVIEPEEVLRNGQMFLRFKMEKMLPGYHGAAKVSSG